MTTDANITQSFIEMVEAFKAKPELEAKIAKLGEDRDFFERHLTIANDLSSKLYADIDELNRQLAEVKKERDDAMFRNLELEELKDKIGGLLGQGLAMFKAPVSESTPAVTQPEAAGPIMPQSEPMAFGVEETDMPSAKPADTSIWPAGPIDPVVVEPQGQSAADPIPAPTEPEFDMYSESTYRNKPYAMKPWWINDAEWERFGGQAKPKVEAEYPF